MNTNFSRTRIATPCPISWEQMAGDERVRFCSLCNLNVYNFSALTKGEAEAIIAATEGRLCARLYRRSDGTVITKDCPVGLKALRRKVSQTAAAVFALISSLATVATAQSRSSRNGSCPPQTRITQSDNVSNAQGTMVTGQVFDPAKAVIPDALIILQNVNTKEAQLTRADEEGRFEFIRMSPGKYLLKIESPGFKKYRHTLELEKNRETNLDVTLLVDQEAVLIGIVGYRETDPPGTTTISEKLLRSLPH